jgi:hypothetical protein
VKELHVRMLSVVAALAAVGGLSFVLGRWSVDEAPATSVSDTVSDLATPERYAAPRQVAQPTLPPACVPATAHDLVAAPSASRSDAEQAPAQASTAATAGWTSPPNKLPPAQVLKNVFEVVHAALQRPDDAGAVQTAQAATLVLGALLQRERPLLKEALSRFSTLTDPDELVVLSSLLGRVADPEVEELALRMAREGGGAHQRAAALRVLGGLDTHSAQGAALRALEREVEPFVRRVALDALPPVRGSSAADADAVVGALLRALEGDEDPQARQRAALRLAEWHRTPADLGPVLEHLSGDTAPEVRAACAISLGVARLRTASVQRALARVLRDAREASEVRRAAWGALGTLSPLPADVLQAYQDFSLAQEAG